MDERPLWQDWAYELGATDDPVAAHALGQGFVLTSGQLAALGSNRARVRREVRAGHWFAVRRDAYAVVPEPTGDDHRSRQGMAALQASACALLRDAVVSHQSAAVLHEIPTVVVPSRPVLTVELHVDAVSRPDIRTCNASLAPEHTTSWFGAPVTTVARTVADLARRNRRAGLIAMDAARRAGTPAEEIAAVLATCVRWPGAVSARATLQLADGRAESPLESLVRLALHDQGLALPDLQVDVLDQHGSFIGRVDMLYRRQRTVIEADGQLKYTDLELWREKQRQERLERAGYRVIRVLWADLRTPATLADRVRWALAHAA